MGPGSDAAKPPGRTGPPGPAATPTSTPAECCPPEWDDCVESREILGSSGAWGAVAARRPGVWRAVGRRAAESERAFRPKSNAPPRGRRGGDRNRAILDGQSL